MIKVPKSKYSEYVNLAESNTCNTVYPLSIAEGYQSGDVYTDSLTHPTCALFWHYCGFAYLSGKLSAGFYQDTIELMQDEKRKNPRRFVLSIDDEEQEAYFSASDNLMKEDFLQNGRGYCVMCGENIATVAFTSAISHNEVDIGIETNEQFRRRGLGVAVAKRTVQYVLSEGKAPVWQCYYKNIGSQHTAEKVGFRRIKTHSFFKVK